MGTTATIATIAQHLGGPLWAEAKPDRSEFSAIHIPRRHVFFADPGHISTDKDPCPRGGQTASLRIRWLVGSKQEHSNQSKIG